MPHTTAFTLPTAADRPRVAWASITAMVEDGALGKIVDEEDEAEHKTIEV